MNIVETDKCTGCSACYSCCPTEAIRMTEDKEGFLVPSIDADKCINCGLCKTKCPANNYKAPLKDDLVAYAASINDDVIRNKSSSGGVFYSIARSVILSGGIVYGTKFIENLHPIIASAKCVDELSSLMGSKYVQSAIGNSYKEIKNDLELKVTVLFVGTPCQVAGLNMYLGKKYDNLILVDLICHGVPSFKLFDRYVSDMNRLYRSKAISVEFRNKKYGWNFYAMKIRFLNGKVYCMHNQGDPWMLAFSDNIMLRKSCYKCSYKTKERISDITLGDLWGVNNVLPEINDNRGLSLLLIHSECGKNLINQVKNSLRLIKIDLKKFEDYNSFHQINEPVNRDMFIEVALNKSFCDAYRRFVQRPRHKTFLLSARLMLSNIKRKMRGC